MIIKDLWISVLHKRRKKSISDVSSTCVLVENSRNIFSCCSISLIIEKLASEIVWSLIIENLHLNLFIEMSRKIFWICNWWGCCNHRSLLRKLRNVLVIGWFSTSSYPVHTLYFVSFCTFLCSIILNYFIWWVPYFNWKSLK